MSKRWKSWLIGIFSLFVILFILLRLIIFFWINPLVGKLLKESVRTYSDDLYQVTYADLQVKPLERRLLIENFSLSFDSAHQSENDALHKNIFVRAVADNVEITIGNVWDLLFNRYFLIRQLYLQNPSVTVYNNADSVSHQEKPFDAYDLIRNHFDSVHVQLINIDEADFSLNNTSGKPFQRFTLEQINAFIAGLVIDSATAHRNSGYPAAEQFELVVESNHYDLPDSLYHISIGNASFFPISGSIVLSDISFNPKLKKRQMARTLGYQKDWMEGKVAQIKLDHIDLRKLIIDNIVDVQLVTVDSAHFHVFKDKRVERRQHQTRPLPSEALQQVKLPFKLDTILLRDASVIYEEQASDADRSGQVSFNSLFASVYNTTNIDSIIHDNMLEADVRAMFMNKSLLQLTFDFSLDKNSQWHRVQGRLEEMPLNVMNQVLEPVAFISIQSGISHLLEFEIEANDDKASGTVNFIYTNLKVKLLNQKNPDEDPKLKQKMGSWITNLLLIKKDNPNGTQPLRKGEISFLRDKEQPVFSYWWHALLSGLEVSVGLENGDGLSSDVSDENGQQKSRKDQKKGLFKRIFKGKENK